jgi:uncharacterized oligopeptide transporter (OPT) family protein
MSKSLPEITPKAIVLGVLLSMVLAGANAYLGLFAGMTVSASIPAAVISMAVLRLFRKSNILENNIVQTAASAGESLAAGVIFTIPALVLMGVWTDFDYLEGAKLPWKSPLPEWMLKRSFLQINQGMHWLLQVPWTIKLLEQ